MVDNRSAGFFGIGGSFNFKSGDISGTAARTQDDKMGQGGEYFAQQKREEEEQERESEKYMDRSAVLRATLNSLAMMNVANVINSKKKQLILDEKNKNNQQNQQKKMNARTILRNRQMSKNTLIYYPKMLCGSSDFLPFLASFIKSSPW